MATVFRTIGAIVVALLAAFALIVGVELFSAVVHPFPPDFDGTEEEVCQHVERYPAWVLAVVVPAWAGTALVSSWIAGRLGNRACGVIVGLILLAALILNISMLPYPIWFEVACVISLLCATVLGLYLSRRRRVAGSLAGE